MAARRIIPPALTFLLSTAFLAACGADAQRSGPGNRPVASTRGDAAVPQQAVAPATAAELQRCEDDLKVQLADADTSGVTDGRTRVVPAVAKDTGKAGQAKGKTAPGASAKTRTYKTATDPGFAVKMGWPPKVPALLPGSILPCHRIVAYYGNPFSKKMGVLGEYPYDEMIRRFRQAVAMWNAADPKHPVEPALQLISVVAQGAPGSDGMYRTRMPDALVQKVYGWAKQEHALLVMDVQIGKSSVQAELPRLEPHLKNPDVMLALDPEFAMKEGSTPGKKIGTLDASDVNYAIGFLHGIVQKYHLPPKILVVHRFTRHMVTNASKIKPLADVQVVIDMDGWGAEWLKRDSYRDYIIREPVEYTGFKIFYHNDVRKPGWSLMQPAQVLAFRPYPLYIQYQ